MTDKHSLSHQDVVNLLDRLKSIKSEYPADLQNKRRTLFLGSIAGGVLFGAPKHVNLPHGVEAPMSTAMKVAIGILTTSAIAVATFLGVLAYENRAILVDHLFGKTPTAVYSNPVPTSANLITPLSSLPIPTSELTPTITPTSTLEPELTPTQGTPAPPVYEPATNNPGLHLGQTPHPGGTPPGQSGH